MAISLGVCVGTGNEVLICLPGAYSGVHTLILFILGVLLV